MAKLSGLPTARTEVRTLGVAQCDASLRGLLSEGGLFGYYQMELINGPFLKTHTIVVPNIFRKFSEEFRQISFSRIS